MQVYCEAYKAGNRGRFCGQVYEVGKTETPLAITRTCHSGPLAKRQAREHAARWAKKQGFQLAGEESTSQTPQS